MSVPRFLCAVASGLLALTVLPAAAATLSCGSYTAEEGSARFVVESSSQATMRYQGLAPTKYVIRQQGNTLHAADVSNGFSTEYSLSRDGKRITGSLGGYVLDSSNSCKTSPAPAANSCRADIDSCVENARTATPQQLSQWCREDLPFACERLLSSYRVEAQDAQQAALPDPDLEEPAVCKEGNPQYNEAACLAAAKEVLGIAMAKALAGALSSSTVILPEPRLNELLQLCRSHPDAGFCGKVADAHWDASRYFPAREALQLACKSGADEITCQRAQSLAALSAADLDAEQASALPCGDYKASTGLMDELGFGNDGLVTVGMGSEMRARLQDGAIHIRHDKGGDFVLKPLRNGGLLGVDEWNRYAVYQRTGGSTQCSAPKVFVELPLPQDCPLGSDPQACCDSGKLQGCNTLGHRNALAGDWQAAAPAYQKLCQAGVRVGCENLRSVYENTADEDIPGKLLSIGKRDGKGTHVACDVYETTNWAMAGLGAQLMRAAGDLDNEDEAEAPAAPSKGKSLRK
ncbi:hypothetical protein [Stenotrophomonas pigmentata]|uniref:hypothetical protein n=1 Tax=Stenotrophomonas pigmentata TaxID=3055080 RepID=UPI0026EC57EF|nr:hypothetical protein [Stenotrophomonas sp. 610A2]